eukprot:2238140-Pleurochrysis_carterae.AAC.2
MILTQRVCGGGGRTFCELIQQTIRTMAANGASGDGGESAVFRADLFVRWGRSGGSEGVGSGRVDGDSDGDRGEDGGSDDAALGRLWINEVRYQPK